MPCEPNGTVSIVEHRAPAPARDCYATSVELGRPSMAARVRHERASDAVSTYRYLRIGMIGAVGLLTTSIWIEHGNVQEPCFQTSISAYYYTPVRAVFVGCLLAVGLALIVIKGRTALEDTCLNSAGMLAPLV
ncbi:hypothetical protein B7486_55270, partial [cyanobacterium TDX16]